MAHSHDRTGGSTTASCADRGQPCALIEEKKKGQPGKPSKPANVEDGKVVDLMEALLNSMTGGAAPRARAERFTCTTLLRKRSLRPETKPDLVDPLWREGYIHARHVSRLGRFMKQASGVATRATKAIR